jgi:phosphate-selective porin OprO and OprP
MSLIHEIVVIIGGNEFVTERKIDMSQRANGFAVGLFCLALSVTQQASAQSAPNRPSAPATVSWLKVPEWKSSDGKAIVRLRGRLIHDVYSIDTDLGGTANDVDISTDGLRAARFGIDGQYTPKIRFRADANLTDSQINWVDVYIGYTGIKYEAYFGQQRLATTFETLGPDVNFPAPETALVNTAFGQSARNLGVVGRVKGAKWQVVGGAYSGNLNAGDVFAEDAQQSVVMRGTYAVRNRDRDVVHVGASLRYRDARQGTLLRYSVRPASTNFGPRTLDSGALAGHDTTFSLEGLAITGPLMFVAEHQIVQADTPRGKATLSGSYLEGAWWLTGENRRYVVGTGSVSQIRPKRSVQAGGLGAFGLVARLEQLDLTDKALGSRAGSQESLSLGAAWLPDEFIMFRVTASQNWIDRPLPTQSGKSRVIMARAQFSF